DDRGAAEGASDEALEIARELGDPATIITVVGLRLVAIWRPDTVGERLRLGAELDAIREQAGTQRSGQFLTTMALYSQRAKEGDELDLAGGLLTWIEVTAAHLRSRPRWGMPSSALRAEPVSPAGSRKPKRWPATHISSPSRPGSPMPKRSSPAIC